MATLDRLDDLERFLLSLQADETFRPHRLWRLPLLGVHDYTLPATVAERLGDPIELGRELAAAERELVVLATDLSDDNDGEQGFELAYSSRETPPEELAQAIFASAAISALVLPLRVGDRIATDGSWVRNYPLGYAYDHPEVEQIVAFRYVPRYPQLIATGSPCSAAGSSASRVVPPVRAFVAELREAEERAERGEPAHLAEMIVRLARVSIVRNTRLEEQRAGDRDEELQELGSLRDDVVGLARERDPELAERIDERFAAAELPLRARPDRARGSPSRASSAGISLDPGFRRSQNMERGGQAAADPARLVADRRAAARERPGLAEAQLERAERVDLDADLVAGRDPERRDDRAGDDHVARAQLVADRLRDDADERLRRPGQRLRLARRRDLLAVAEDAERDPVRRPAALVDRAEHDAAVEDVAGEDRLRVGRREVDVGDLDRDRRARRSSPPSPTLTASSGSSSGSVQSPIGTVAPEGSSVASVRKPTSGADDPEPLERRGRAEAELPAERPLARLEPAPAQLEEDVASRQLVARRPRASPRRSSPRSAARPRRRCCRSRASGRAA